MKVKLINQLEPCHIYSISLDQWLQNAYLGAARVILAL